MAKTTSARERARATLIPLARDVAATSLELEEWRREAGAKAKWSNHMRLEEARLFGVLEREAAALSAAMVALIPAHWDMADWAFKPARMGGKLRWSSKGGRGQGGINLETDESHFLAKLGVLAGLATHGGKATPEEAARMDALGLSSRAPFRMELVFDYRGFLPITAFTPSDGFAAIHIAGHVPFSLTVSEPSADPAEAFEDGLKVSDRAISAKKTWSAAPTLFTQLRRDPRAKKLAGRIPSALPRTSQSHPAETVNFDRCTSMALSLLEALPAKPGKMQRYLIRREGSDVQVQAWCGTSAMLALLIRQLCGRTLKNADVLTWQVYAVADEQGDAARRIAERFEVEATPVV